MNNIRSQALKSMLKEPMIPMAKRPMGEEQGEAPGMISMMVTPEEQQMILAGRKEGGAEGEVGMEGAESEAY